MNNKNNDMESDYNKPQYEEGNTPLIDRKEAIRKAGYVALSAATMMLLISKPDKAVASSPASPPVW
ncbi:MAG: hypothetical protein RBS73_08925 [Prolixibacteraceae bacterium]|nr:hypothetical protein [Prolixibacteraceae bacterium]